MVDSMAAPSFEPKTFTISMPRSCQPSTIHGASGAEPELILRMWDMSIESSMASLPSNMFSNGGGATV